MRTLLITEGLQEIKINKALISKKRNTIHTYATRLSTTPDPLEKEGGTAKFLNSELHAIKDLEHNIVKIRLAITRKNLETNLSVKDVTKSISEWIVWRRDISEMQESSAQILISRVQQARAAHERDTKQLQKQVDMNPNVVIKESTILVLFDEQKLLKETEKTSEILGLLDGQLSVLNATTSIEIE